MWFYWSYFDIEVDTVRFPQGARGPNGKPGKPGPPGLPVSNTALHPNNGQSDFALI